MLEFYPKRVNPGWALWSSARAVKSWERKLRPSDAPRPNLEPFIAESTPKWLSGSS
jgi:hypothetical protein